MTEETRKRLIADSVNFGERVQYGVDDDISTVFADNFLEGADWSRNNIWHPSDEQPQPGRELIVITFKGIKIYPNPSNSKMAWPFFVRISRADRWAYAEDILPDKDREKEKNPFF